MATKMCFRVNEEKVFDEEVVAFTYIKGMAFSQKCKNVLSFHSSIQSQFPHAKILEISTKSNNPFGVALSAFNLTLDGCPVECLYHASKVFENGVCFEFLKEYSPRDAKRYIRENNDNFTDIEFNEKKGLNCQAHSCAIYSYMLRTGTVDKYMHSMEDFEKIYDL